MFTVVLVDDEPAILNALTRLFRQDRQHLRIITTSSGKQALEILSLQPVHAVISDLQMPEMDGTALLRRVKELTPNVIRILLTGTPEMATATPAHCILAKPCSRQDLLASLQIPEPVA